MGTDMTSGIVLLIVIGAMLLVMFIVAFGKAIDEGTGDIDPWERDPRDL